MRTQMIRLSNQFSDLLIEQVNEWLAENVTATVHSVSVVHTKRDISADVYEAFITFTSMVVF